MASRPKVWHDKVNAKRILRKVDAVRYRSQSRRDIGQWINTPPLRAHAGPRALGRWPIASRLRRSTREAWAVRSLLSCLLVVQKMLIYT